MERASKPEPPGRSLPVPLALAALLCNHGATSYCEDISSLVRRALARTRTEPGKGER